MRRGDPRLPVVDQMRSEGLELWLRRLLVRLHDRFFDLDQDVEDAATHQYGEMYADNISQTIVIATANTWTDITGGLSAGDNTVAFTFQNSSELKCNIKGKYMAYWSLSLETTGANDDIEGSISVNATVVIRTKSHQAVGTPNEEFHMSSQAILTLEVNDIVRLTVNNNTDADDIVLEHANLMLLKIGD